MGRTKKILIVDDDDRIRDVVRFALDREGYETIEAGDGAEALRSFDAAAPDLLILDILMPEMDGTDVCRAIRARSQVPIIFLSSKDDEVDRIIGLELGGDDYVSKPFSPRELVARVRAVFRRLDGLGTETTGPLADTSRALRHGRLRLDPVRHLVFWDTRDIPLTVTEFGLLRTLLTHPGRVYSRDELMHGAYSFEHLVTDRTIDSHVRRIRKKLGSAAGSVVETVHGVGYKLGPCD